MRELLLIPWLLAAALVHAGPAPGDVSASTRESAAVLAWKDARARHAQALSEVLLDSNNPRHLVVAARLMYERERYARYGGAAEPNAEASAQRVRDANAAMRRALQLGHDDPLIWWVAATDCPASDAVCDAPRAVARLRELVPDNAAVWALPDAGMDRAHQGQPAVRDPARERERLIRIAAADHHDSYFSERLRVYHDAFGQAPFPPGMLQARPDMSNEMAVQYARAERAFGLFLADRLVEVPALRALCDSDAIEHAEASRSRHCVDAMRRVLHEADSAASHRAASQALLRLLPDGPERQAVEREQLRIDWQIGVLSELHQERRAAAAPNEPFLPSDIVLWLAPGATELQVLQQTLEAAGVSPTPPPRWRGWTAGSAAPQTPD